MARQRTAVDNSMLVFGVIMFILTVSLFGVTGAVVDQDAFVGTVYLVNFGVASWYLITTILAIVSGATGNQCSYIAVIVTSVFAIFAALAAGIVFALLAAGVFSYTTNFFGGSYYRYNFRYGSLYDDDDFYFNIGSLPIGAAVINSLSFIALIVISSIGCCGACCNQPSVMPGERLQTTTVINTSYPMGGVGGHALSANPYGAPPGYIQNPPPQPYGNVNAGYDMQSYGKS